MARPATPNPRHPAAIMVTRPEPETTANLHFSPAVAGSGSKCPARQGCRSAIDRARLPTYCTLGDVHELLSTAAVVRNAS